MSFAIWNWMKVYQRWRTRYLETRPPWKLPLPEEPIITWGEKKKVIEKKTKIGIVLAFAVFLALSSDSK